MKCPAVYIMANKRNGTLYTGVTSNLVQRAYQHKAGVTAGFTTKHNCTSLVYYDVHDDLPAAIAHEKQIKAGSRRKKMALIEAMNPGWRDLYKASSNWITTQRWGHPDLDCFATLAMTLSFETAS